MAIQNNNAEKLNAAITHKVDKILKNTDHIESVRIVIEGNREEYPSIYYGIKEYISTDDYKPDSDYVMKEGERNEQP